MSRFLAITGPTTSGKTALSLTVAKALGGEIVSMDSRQIYRGMDIGTDKLPESEWQGIPHWCFDLRDPDQAFSAADFARNARVWIAEIAARGHVPVLVGGTGFFLRALTDPLVEQPDVDPGRRERLRAHLSALGPGKLERWVRVLDPDRADLAAEGGPQRLGRTVEVALLTGRRLSWWHEHGRPEAEPAEGLVVVLDMRREELDERIERRVNRMLGEGLVDEVRRLVEAGYGPESPGMSGTGYRQIAEHLRGDRTLDDAIDAMKRATKRYARRQMTWFRHQLPPGAVRVDGALTMDQQVDAVVGAWQAAAGAASAASGGEV